MSRSKGDRGYQPNRDLWGKRGDMGMGSNYSPENRTLASRKERRKINNELGRKTEILNDIEEASHHNFEEDDIQDSITFESREIMACNTWDLT